MKFEEILIIITLITGVIWLFDRVFYYPSRRRTHLGVIKEPVIVEYCKAFFPVLLIVLLLRSFIAEPFKIPSASMKPGLIEGDFILVNKFIYGLRIPVLGTRLFGVNTPKRGDVIVFRHTGHKDLIKRVVGLPGDHINYKNKILYVNNKAVTIRGKDLFKDSDDTLVFKQTEELAGHKHKILTLPGQPAIDYPYADFMVPKNSYFVLGDNRDNSQDSRFWGAVNDQAIIGKAFFIWWSWDAMSFYDLITFWQITVRWDRVASKIK